MKILVVEDSFTQLIKLQFTLENAGHYVLTAKNGIEGLDKVAEHEPDLIISDILMPEMNGYEFCKSIKQDPRHKHIPVMLLTALTDPEDVIGGLKCGADNFFTKPYNDEFLLSRIQHIQKNEQIRASSGEAEDTGIEIYFGEKKHCIHSSRTQMLDLLFSSFENAIHKNNELEMVIQQLKETQQQLEQEKNRAEEATKSKSKILGIAAHDMKNPLSGIGGITQIIREQLSEGNPEELESSIEMLSFIENSAKSMLKLVEEMLNAEAIESGHIHLQTSLVCINELVESVLRMNTARAESKEITIHHDLEEEIFSAVDSQKIYESFDNLISNAIKYSPLGTSVYVSLKRIEDSIIFSVKDEGPGLHPSEKGKLFQRFAKLSPRPTGGEISTGLGLSIVKQLVELHQGHVFCKTELGKGSTFSIELPIRTSKET